MFIASKYQDVYPLLMRTVFNKIGHKKISIEAIREKELDVLRSIGFAIGSFPSSLEFLDKYIEQVFSNHPERKFINLMSIYLAKMSSHHENLCHKKSSVIGASSIYVAMKICE